MLQNHRPKRSFLESTQRMLHRHVHSGHVLLLFLALCAFVVMTYTVLTLKSRPLVIKLHNSEQRFVEEALHEILLVPEKLAPTETPESVLKEKCVKFNKGKCRKCSSKDKSSEAASHDGKASGGADEAKDSSGRQSATFKVKVAVEGALPVKEIWPARRREWKEDAGIQRLGRLFAASTLFRRNIDLMHMKLPPPLQGFKNPCFLASPREKTRCRAGPFETWERFSSNNHRGAVLDKRKRRLSCLPYFIIAGMPKSGASELMYALSQHRDVTYPLPFQSRWFENTRFEESCGSVDAYLDFFDPTAQMINKSVNEEGVRNMIAGESCVVVWMTAELTFMKHEEQETKTYCSKKQEKEKESNKEGPRGKRGQRENETISVSGEVAENILWDNHLWPVLPGNEGQLEPRYTNADYLHHLDPLAKIIIILRDPVERLYDEYHEDAIRMDFEPSAEDFHSRVQYKLDVLRTCLWAEPIRSCVYDAVSDSFDKSVRIRSGMYVVMIQDWLRAFPRDQVHVINYETFQRGMRIEFVRIVKFLGLKDVTFAQVESMVLRARPSGTGKKEQKENKKKDEENEEDDDDEENEDKVERREEGDEEEGEGGREEMLEETREMLNRFYRPLNKLLATVLEDESYLWE